MAFKKADLKRTNIILDYRLKRMGIKDLCSMTKRNPKSGLKAFCKAIAGVIEGKNYSI